MCQCGNLIDGLLESNWIGSEVKPDTEINEFVQSKGWQQKRQWIIWEQLGINWENI